MGLAIQKVLHALCAPVAEPPFLNLNLPLLFDKSWERFCLASCCQYVNSFSNCSVCKEWNCCVAGSFHWEANFRDFCGYIANLWSVPIFLVSTATDKVCQSPPTVLIKSPTPAHLTGHHSRSFTNGLTCLCSTNPSTEILTHTLNYLAPHQSITIQNMWPSLPHLPSWSNTD